MILLRTLKIFLHSTTKTIRNRFSKCSSADRTQMITSGYLTIHTPKVLKPHREQDVRGSGMQIISPQQKAHLVENLAIGYLLRILLMNLNPMMRGFLHMFIATAINTM